MQAHPDIMVFGYSEAAMFLRGAEGARVGAIISIHGAQEFGVEAEVARRLDLEFDDVEVAEEGDPIGAYHVREQLRHAAENGRELVPPTVEDARAILRFAEEIRGMEGVLLCHCLGGVSRSAAAAILCLAAWTGAGEERRVVEYVRRMRPCAMPHGGLIRFGDVLLGRNGALMAANQ